MTTREELPKKIAVLMGGPGSERDVSLATGRGVAKALRSLGADVMEIDVRNEEKLMHVCVNRRRNDAPHNLSRKAQAAFSKIPPRFQPAN